MNNNSKLRVLVVSSVSFISEKQETNDTTGLCRILEELYCKKSDIYNTYYWSTRFNLKHVKSDLVTNFNSIQEVKFYEILKLLAANAKNKSDIKEDYKKYQFEKMVRKIQPDIVHFHDLSDTNLELIDYCCKNSISCIITLHIFIGKQFIVGYEKLKILEEIFFSAKYNIKITTVSSGVKKRILQQYNFLDEKDIDVIENATNLPCRNNPLFSYARSKCRILCVGRICERKNQLQLVRAYHLLKECVKDKVEIVFIGGGDKLYINMLKREIKELNESNNITYIGKCLPNEMGEYYRTADMVITVSLNESFGLTIIEGMSYGLPCIAFGDLDAIDDIYDKKAMILIDGHSDKDIADAINRAINTSWNRKHIIQHSKKFSNINMIKEYEKLYLRIVGKK